VFSDSADQESALRELEDDVYAASSIASVKARRGLITKLLAAWGLEPHPLDQDKLRKLAASLKRGGYRSSVNILSQYKVDAERRGQSLDATIVRCLADIGRSCRRGLGPPCRAAPLPFERLSSLPGGVQPWARGGPIAPRNAIVVGSWWLLRETELSGARARMVTLTFTPSPTITLLLPASKTDQAAEGVARSHACICPPGSVRGDCPAHAVWDQLLCLRRLLPSRFTADVPHLDLPLFPSSSGGVVPKKCMTETIAQAARKLGVDLVSADGATRVSGHSLRVTGAQGLTRIGVDTWAVQLLGRWGSNTVQTYIRDAASGPEAAAARRHGLQRTLADLAADRELLDASSGLEAALRQHVAEALAEATPAFVQSLRSALLPDLAAELRRATPDAISSSSSSSSESSENKEEEPEPEGQASLHPGFASGEVAAIYPGSRRHRVVVGPRVTLCQDSWVTACGWKFGRKGAARDPTQSDLRCTKCWPTSVQVGVDSA